MEGKKGRRPVYANSIGRYLVTNPTVFTTSRGPKTSAGVVQEMRFVGLPVSLSLSCKWTATIVPPLFNRLSSRHRYDGHESSSVLFLVANSEVSNLIIIIVKRRLEKGTLQIKILHISASPPLCLVPLP